jgi:predicted dehydrogenase
VVTTKKLLPSLGRIVAVNGLWTIYKPSEYFDPPTEWRRLDSAGPIFINLIHEIDILHHLFGPIIRVFGEGTVSQREFDAEEGAAITLKFANGIVGTFLLSDAVVSPHNFEGGTGENPTIPATGKDFYRIFGSEGSLSVPDMTRWSYSEKRSWTERLDCESLKVPDMKIPFELQIEHFIRVVRGLDDPSCSGTEGLRAVVVCEAIKRSMREQQPIDIIM